MSLRDLSEGMQGEDVRAVQEGLRTTQSSHPGACLKADLRQLRDS
jgi:hypothetical protein